MCIGVTKKYFGSITNFHNLEEEEEESEEEEEEEETADITPTDGLQTPSGMETPSGLTSVVSTVAGGLETPDFLELRKNAVRAASDSSDTGPRSLYQVVPERQTSIRGLMGSERGYDVSGISGGSVPVLGDERSTKVMCCNSINSVHLLIMFFICSVKPGV